MNVVTISSSMNGVRQLKGETVGSLGDCSEVSQATNINTINKASALFTESLTSLLTFRKLTKQEDINQA